MHAGIEIRSLIACMASNFNVGSTRRDVMQYSSGSASSETDLSGDGEVDEVGGNADLWQVVRVGQLGAHVQLEVGIVVYI